MITFAEWLEKKDEGLLTHLANWANYRMQRMGGTADQLAQADAIDDFGKTYIKSRPELHRKAMNMDAAKVDGSKAVKGDLNSLMGNWKQIQQNARANATPVPVRNWGALDPGPS